MTTPLLAKSQRDPTRVAGAETLRGHTLLVVRAAKELLEHRGAASLRAAGLALTLEDRLRKIVLLGAFIHDLGKANDHFQAMVRHNREAPQLVRHEAVSLWLTWPGQLLADWLRPAVADSLDYLLAILAAAGHHRRFAAESMPPPDSGAGTTITILCGHPDFAHLLGTASNELMLDTAPVSPNSILHINRRWTPKNDFDRWECEASDTLRRDATARKLLALAKALVLDADVAGSALPREGEKVTWIGTQLSLRADNQQLAQIVAKRLGGAPPRPFQERVAASTSPITLVRAGCGSGKTAAAYLWAARQHGRRQLWITYPTTGTTTEGFRDYLADVEIEARLEHSRADLDLEMLGLRDERGARDRDRLDAIRGWGANVVTCTVDTVLGLMQNQRKGLYAWAGLADAALVFDEIHSYDHQLFGTLLRFLEALPGIPVLLMTASLPADRLDTLRSVARSVHARDLRVVDGPPELEMLPRYIRVVSDEPWRLVNESIRLGAKVLWVNNTVDRCINAAAMDGEHSLIYHSRFRYIDRVDRHAAVIDAFRRTGPALAVTTQVAEMSLDLSADLLVTDLAPVPSLIQRLGRLNRRASPDAPSEPKPFLVVPFRGLPYADDTLNDAVSWLDRLGHGPISQADLIAAWRPGGFDAATATPSAWLDGGFNTAAAPVREEAYGITVLREQDATAAMQDAREAIARALPMGPPPRALAWRSWRRVRGYPVAPAPSINYDAARGATWRH